MKRIKKSSVAGWEEQLKEIVARARSESAVYTYQQLVTLISSLLLKQKEELRKKIFKEIREAMSKRKIWFHALSPQTVTEGVFDYSRGWDNCLKEIDDLLKVLEVLEK